MKQKNTLPFYNINDNFESEAVLNCLKKLEIYKTNQNLLVTKLENQVICRKSVSERYGALDFGVFIQNLIPQILVYFKPITFNLTIKRGIQQINFNGETIEIRGEVYHKRFSLFSSTNQSSMLIVNAGLVRQVCTNGSAINIGANINKKAKHYHILINALFEWICSELPNLENAFCIQIEHILKMDETKVSLRKFMLLIIKGKIKEETKTGIANVTRFTKMLYESPTDGIDSNTLSEKENLAILNPLKLLAQNSDVEDFYITKHKMFNIYIELFKNRNLSLQQKESQKAFEILNEL